MAVDRSMQMIAYARERYRDSPQLSFDAADAESLSFEACSFDVAVTMLTLELVEQPERVLREMVRVTRQGGRIVVGILPKWNLWNVCRRLRGVLGCSPWNKGKFYTARDVETRLSKVGCAPLPRTTAVYVPPCGSRFPVPYYSVIEAIGRKVFPSLGAFAGVRAIKG